MMRRKFFFPFLVFAFASSAQAIPITATSISPLNLGVLTPGDPSTSISPGTSENSQNASLAVVGDPNASYSIILPSGSVALTTGAGGASETITLSSFNSFPTAGASGQLDSNGQQMLFIGATRSAIQLNQVPGAYNGSFIVTVTY